MCLSGGGQVEDNKWVKGIGDFAAGTRKMSGRRGEGDQGLWRFSVGATVGMADGGLTRYGIVMVVDVA